MKKNWLLLLAVCALTPAHAAKPLQPVSGFESRCTTDAENKLMWEIKRPADKGGLHDINHTYTWFDPSNQPTEGHPVKRTGRDLLYCKGSACNTYDYIAAVNRRGLCGYKDWRMPTLGELKELLKQEKESAGEERAAKQADSSDKAAFYWSSDKDEQYSFLSWGVNFSTGAAYKHTQSDAFHVRLVRDLNQWQTVPGYTDQCIIDRERNIMWEMKSPPGRGGLHDARNLYTATYSGKNHKLCRGSACNIDSYIAAVNRKARCGYRDWRLPSVEELNTLVQRDQNSPPYIDRNIFPYTDGKTRVLRVIKSGSGKDISDYDNNRQVQRWLERGAEWVERENGDQVLQILSDSAEYWARDTDNGTVAISFIHGKKSDSQSGAKHIRLVRDFKRFSEIQGYAGECLRDSETGLVWEVKTGTGKKADKPFSWNSPSDGLLTTPEGDILSFSIDQNDKMRCTRSNTSSQYLRLRHIRDRQLNKTGCEIRTPAGNLYFLYAQDGAPSYQTRRSVNNAALHEIGDTFTWSRRPALRRDDPDFCIVCNVNDYVRAVNRRGLCGYKDWRLPSLDELITLLDTDKSAPPYYDNDAFGESEEQGSHYYWTSSVYPFDSSRAYGVNFNKGFDNNLPKNKAHRVRLVRGKQRR